jgi:hypothetical protein
MRTEDIMTTDDQKLHNPKARRAKVAGSGVLCPERRSVEAKDGKRPG